MTPSAASGRLCCQVAGAIPHAIRLNDVRQLAPLTRVFFASLPAPHARTINQLQRPGINTLRRYTTSAAAAPIAAFDLSTRTFAHAVRTYPFFSALTAYALYSWGSAAYGVAKAWWMQLLGYMIHKPPEEYEFGDISSAALAASSASISKTSAALQSLIGKSWDEYRWEARGAGCAFVRLVGWLAGWLCIALGVWLGYSQLVRSPAAPCVPQHDVPPSSWPLYAHPYPGSVT